MTNTANINPTKGKIILALLTFLLALMAAAALQSPALAETATTPSTSRDSLGTGQPEIETDTKGGVAKKLTGKQSGTMTSKLIPAGYSYSPGYSSFNQLVGTPYYYGDMVINAGGGAVYRSSAYSGTQDITVTSKIYKFNPNTGIWDPFAFPARTVRTYSGQYAQMPHSKVTHWDTTANYFYVDLVIEWKTTDGRLIGRQIVRTAHSSDYYCNRLSSLPICRTGGTQGSLVWLYMSQ